MLFSPNWGPSNKCHRNCHTDFIENILTMPELDVYCLWSQWNITSCSDLCTKLTTNSIKLALLTFISINALNREFLTCLLNKENIYFSDWSTLWEQAPHATHIYTHKHDSINKWNNLDKRCPRKCRKMCYRKAFIAKRFSDYSTMCRL